MKYTSTGVCGVNGGCTNTTVETAANTLNASIYELKSAYVKQNGNEDIAQTVFDASHNALMTQAENVLNLRSSIDQTFANLSKPKSEITRDYDASVYTGIGLSIAAVSLAYYIIRN